MVVISVYVGVQIKPLPPYNKHGVRTALHGGKSIVHTDNTNDDSPDVYISHWTSSIYASIIELLGVLFIT